MTTELEELMLLDSSDAVVGSASHESGTDRIQVVFYRELSQEERAAADAKVEAFRRQCGVPRSGVVLAIPEDDCS